VRARAVVVFGEARRSRCLLERAHVGLALEVARLALLLALEPLALERVHPLPLALPELIREPMLLHAARAVPRPP
jgi:hypothetical protein